MPQSASATDAPKDLNQSFTTKLIDSIVPDIAVNMYHKIAKANVSLTRNEQITSFNSLITALDPFCNPLKNYELLPEIGNCWEVFIHSRKNSTTYEFTNAFQFEKLTGDYKTRRKVGGKKYWDYPLTSAILGYVTKAPCMQKNSNQSLARLTFAYISSLALTMATTTADEERYTTICHFKKVMATIIHDDCKQVFADDDLRALISMNERINEHHLVIQKEREAAFIPIAVNNFAMHSRELASQLFSLLLIATEGSNKESLSHDYKKIDANKITDDKNPAEFTACSPFKETIKASARALSELNSLTDTKDTINKLSTPKTDDVKSFILDSAHSAQSYYSSWWPWATHKHGVLHYFLKAKHENNEDAEWIQPTHNHSIHNSANKLIAIVEWLKYTIVLSSAIKSLNLLLSIDGQKWIAQGGDAIIIQALFRKAHDDLLKFQDKMSEFKIFLNSRMAIGSERKYENEHRILNLTNTIEETSTVLIKNGVTPLLNIEEKYLIATSHAHDARAVFFERIIKLLADSDLGFSMPNIKPAPPIPIDDKAQDTNINLQPNITIANHLDRLIKSAFVERKLEQFLHFWNRLLYVDNAKLPQLLEFHRKYRYQEKKLQQQRNFSIEHRNLLESPNEMVAEVGAAVFDRLYPGKQKNDKTIINNINGLEINLENAKIDCDNHLENELNINYSQKIITAWSDDDFKILSNALNDNFDIKGNEATDFLEEIAKLLLQKDKNPNKNISVAFNDLLFISLDNVARHAGAKIIENKNYWRAISKGIMMLGASPLPWMTHKMTEKELPTANHSHGFYVSAEQATLILSSLTYRASLLGETSIYAKDKLDNLINATEAFGLRLYSCVADDESWWWQLGSIFTRYYDGARIERATMFWATIRWIYIALNEQIIIKNPNDVKNISINTTNPNLTEEASAALKKIAAITTDYKTKVPRVSKCYNQGFATWNNLLKAIHDFNDSIGTMSSLRQQKSLALANHAQTTQNNNLLEENNNLINLSLKTLITAQFPQNKRSSLTRGGCTDILDTIILTVANTLCKQIPLKQRTTYITQKSHDIIKNEEDFGFLQSCIQPQVSLITTAQVMFKQDKQVSTTDVPSSIINNA